jgi:uncharacterized membrane protein HdeD (DUF308 family)
MLVTNEILGSVHIKWRWLLGLGILFVVLGTIGLGASIVLTIASVVFFGVLLLIGGGYQFVDAFRYSGWKSRISHILIALLYVIAGVIVVNDPMGASSIFTMMIAGALIAIGIVRIFMAYQMRQIKGWGWLLVGGIAAIALGAMIVAEWPLSGLWGIGMLIAIEMLFAGWGMVMMALTVKDLERKSIEENNVTEGTSSTEKEI